jgi:hypothetical protein
MTAAASYSSLLFPSTPAAPAEGSETCGRCVYLFCCARAEAAAMMMSMTAAGLEPEQELYMLALGDFVAVACDVRLADWTGAGGEANLANLAWVAPRALHHQSVLEQVMASSPILPMPVGTLFSSQEALLLWLAQRYHRIVEFLTDIADKEEWSLKLLLDAPRAEAQWLAREQRQPPGGTSVGSRYLLEKKLRGEATQRVRQVARQTEAALYEKLRGVILLRQARRLLPQHSPDAQHQALSHSALLIQAARREELLAMVATFNASHQESGMRVDMSGPWPAATFVPSFSVGEGAAGGRNE